MTTEGSASEHAHWLSALHEVVSTWRARVPLRALADIGVMLMPFALIAWAAAIVLGLVGDVFGIPALFHWLWALFGNAESWWAKAWIALANIVVAGTLVWTIVFLGGRLTRHYRR